MLKIENLHASVAGKEILKGLSLEVKSGELHSIVDFNSAGKSTNSIQGQKKIEIQPRMFSRLTYKLTAVAVFFTAICSCAWADQPPTDEDANKPFCDGAQNQVEVDICTGASYAAADKELNAAYQAVLRKWVNYPAVLSKLRQAQRDWLVYRDADIKARFADDEGSLPGSNYPAVYASYEASLTRERTARLCRYLRGTADGEADPAPCTELIKHPRIMPAPTH